jgi:hypothetical protein
MTTDLLERPTKSTAFVPSLAVEAPPVAKQASANCNGSAAYMFAPSAWSRTGMLCLPSSTMVIFLVENGISNLPLPRTVATAMETRDMVGHLRDLGLPMAALADILDVERKTVYLWADGGMARPENHDRLVQVYTILGHEEPGSLRFFYRFWDRKLPDGGTLREILIDSHLDSERARAALEFLRPHVAGAMCRDIERREYLANQPKSPASSMTLHLRAGV